MKLPKRRRNQLIVKQLPDETLVYDLKRHKAHCLNQSAALIWRHCDGKTSVAELMELLHKECRLPKEPAVIGSALERLEKAGLLEASPDLPNAGASTSRRTLMRKIGLAGAAGLLLPVIHTILAPEAYAAGSTINAPLCNSGNPLYLGKCCSDKHKVCGSAKGGGQACNGAAC